LCDNLGLKNELCSHPYVNHSTINIPDAFNGGRTKATKTYYRVKQWEENLYVDVICLYPHICKYGKLSVGHTKLYVGADCPLEFLDRKWIIKRKVLLPTKLYHPVLPYKSNSKLVFLCYACADSVNEGNCTHTDEERYIVGNSAVNEVRKAIEICYGLVKVFEFCQYGVTCFDRGTHLGVIFAMLI